MARPVSANGWHQASAALMAALLAGAIASFRSYGVAADEPTQQAYGALLDRFYATGGSDVRCNFSWDWRYYGGLFEAPASWIAARSPLGVHATRSLLTALAGLTGIAGCWHAALGLGGPRVAFLAALILALIPGWWGQMFINSKDVPFAAASAWALSGLVRIARGAPGAPRLALAAWTGLAIGAALGIRAGGVLYAGYLALLLSWLALGSRRPAWSFAGAFLAALAVAWIVMLVAWPWALAHPLTGLPLALRYFERFPTPFPVLFEGRVELATHLPRAYLPELLGFTLPEPVLLLLAAGAGLAIAAIRRHGRPGTPASLAVASTIVVAAFPVCYAVIRRTPEYNGIRHFLFIIPAIACLCAVSLDTLLAALGRAGRIALVAVMTASAARQLAETARLFPYEYAWFNSFCGGLPGAAGRFDVEYWGTAVTEAALNLAKVAPTPPRGRRWRVNLCGDWSGTAEAFGPAFVRAAPGTAADFYVGSRMAWADCRRPAEGRTVIQVARAGVVLAEALAIGKASTR